ncbi:MAG: hypothetical protein AAF570_15780, partial [Bacteroidota bacterium]
MNKLFLSFISFLLLQSAAFGQSGAVRSSFQIPLGGEVVAREQTNDYHPLLQRVEAPYPGGNSEKAKAMRMKKEIAEKYAKKWENEPIPAHKTIGNSGGGDPWVGTNFRSNFQINGVPNDNDMAISNDGDIISVINSNIWMHDSAGTALTNISLDNWALPLNIAGNKFDPRALYDPIHDRFIIACLNGFTDSTNYIIVGFSETSDPTGNWHLYALPGDPKDDSLWTDYPIMSLNPYELVITGNLLLNDEPWQTGFVRSLAWQIDLDSAYAGGTLETTLWDSVYFQGKPIRNLCPIQGGSTPAGTNTYLLSNRNFATGNDTVWIMEITDTMNAPGVQFLVDYGVSDIEYHMPSNGMQQFMQQLATNDARWLDGFIENGNIQFVGNTMDTLTGLA